MLMDSNDVPMVDNFRPLQELNDRQVYSSFEIPGQRMEPPTTTPTATSPTTPTTTPTAKGPTADATAVSMTAAPFLLMLVAALFKY